MHREMLEARREYIEALAELSSTEAQLNRVLGTRPGPWPGAAACRHLVTLSSGPSSFPGPRALP
jgi:hypothetical protein